MKILYYSSTSYADCDFPLVRTMMEKGHDVTYLIELAQGNRRSTLFNIANLLPVNEIIPATSYKELASYNKYMDLNKVYLVNHGVIGGGKLKTYWTSLKSVLKVARFIKRGHFDVIHTDFLFSAFQIFLYLLFRHWVCTIHDPFAHSDEVSKADTFKRKMCFKYGDRFVLLNNNQYGRFCDKYRIKPSKVLINRLGVYDNIHAFIEDDWQTKKNNVLFFGRIVPYKGVEYLCEAMKKVHEIIPDATLTLAGSGKYYFDISEYRKLPYVEIKNHYITMEELAHLVFECTICVCPYTEATQSGVIMTSFSMCKPVVATTVGGLGEMVEHEKSGLMIEPCNSEVLADAIIRLLSNDNELNKMTDYIKKEYFDGEKSWGSIVDNYIDFYKRT